ncbi:MBOAT family O-acyltransferase [Fulvivirga ligni]|uniref:MBOAT family O-acyltransferase n=1 Tax=Fulvivirga ligni TaxID=2904246 RepID=UPI001F16D2A1|nr:MBOAT family O-acyltransferase [Fulvivirga ligni]UII23881.1 MBOAT family protein [Fulvivirga ligni]
MLFNSIDFAIFLPIVFILYWFVLSKQIKVQNLLILVASYVFYGWWDWRFLSLIAFSTLVDFIIGVSLKREQSVFKRKALLWTSISINLGFLAFFKYYNFFINSFVDAFSLFGSQFELSSLNIILPVGISFYTFQTLSYSIDVYKRKLEPTKDFIAFGAFVSFFPQLVAGPIERASHLLPQFYNRRKFDYGKSIDGLRQMLWGLFKKIVIADNCAEFANQIFDNYDHLTGSTLILGAIFFTFQIYGDFSGYSDIAIGVSRLFGFDLMQNFNYPYFSRDMAEFWRRWHISLSTWFRDYLYIPLGGSRGGKWMQIRNTFIIFIVSGFWHGANWTFIVWGFLNACYFLPLLLFNRNRQNIGDIAVERIFPSYKDIISIFITFSLSVFAWIFFRSESLSHALHYISGIMSPSVFLFPKFNNMGHALETFILILIFILIEWNGRGQKYAIATLGFSWRRSLRLALYYTLVIAIFWYGGNEQEFIYFQF